jgi:hypothetical protein
MNDLLQRIFLRRSSPGCSCDMCLAIPSVRPCEVRDLVKHTDMLEKAVQRLLDAKTEADTLVCLHTLRILINEE